MNQAVTSVCWRVATPDSSEVAVNTDAAAEDAPTADQVADASGQEQQSAEGDQVRVHRPGEARLEEADLLELRRQVEGAHGSGELAVANLRALSSMLGHSLAGTIQRPSRPHMVTVKWG